MSGLAKLCIMICQTLQNPNLILKVITREQKKKKSSLLLEPSYWRQEQLLDREEVSAYSAAPSCQGGVRCREREKEMGGKGCLFSHLFGARDYSRCLKISF